MTLRSEFVIATVLEALDVLCRETDLSPRNETINRTLTSLVATLASAYSHVEEQAVLADPRVINARPKLLEKLSQAESEMEKYWIDRFLAKETLAADDLKEFWYWDCYERLLELEMDCLPPDALDGDGSAAFVGSGALPLSAIIMHLKTGMPVTCIDSDLDACIKAEGLIAKLGLPGISIVHANGEDVDYAQFSTVFIASLVPNPAKEAIAAKISSLANSSYIVLRSAERLHTLLYEPFDPEDKGLDGYRLVGKTAFDTQVINTALVYRNNFAFETQEKPVFAAAKLTRG